MNTELTNDTQQAPKEPPLIITKYATFGLLAGILPIYALTIIANIGGDGLLNTLIYALPALVLFVTFGAIIGFIPALLTGIVVSYVTKHDLMNGIVHPASIGFVVTMIYAIIFIIAFGIYELELIVSSSTIIATIGAFASFIVDRYFIRKP